MCTFSKASSLPLENTVKYSSRLYLQMIRFAATLADAFRSMVPSNANGVLHEVHYLLSFCPQYFTNLEHNSSQLFCHMATASYAKLPSDNTWLFSIPLKEQLVQKNKNNLRLGGFVSLFTKTFQDLPFLPRHSL